MKTFFYIFAFLASTALAQERSAVTAPVTLLALNGALGVGVPAQVEIFAGATFDLKAIFSISSGITPNIAADLYLDGLGLGAPLQKDLKFSPDKPADNLALHSGVFSIPLEKVGQPTNLRLIIRAQNSDGGAWAKVADIKIRIYPADYFSSQFVQALQPKPEIEPRPLSIFGDDQGLRDLFTKWGVLFTDLGQGVPDEIKDGAIVIGCTSTEPEPNSDAPKLFGKSSLLWFRPDAAKPNGVFQKTGPAGIVSIVTLPPPALWSQSPFFQRLLLEYLQLILPPYEK